MDLNIHGTDEQLELYARGRLSHPEVVVLEEHLFVCEACRELLEQNHHWNEGLREAFRDPEPEPGWQAWPLFAWTGTGWVRQPAFAVALLVIVVAAGIGVYSRGGASLAPVATLELAAMRGDMPDVPAAREFDLTLTDAPGEGLRVVVVDSAGATVWQGRTAKSARGAEVKMDTALKPGTWFVRLYGQDGAMLHEYGFKVK